MLCVAAPPSDQDTKSYCLEFKVCGEDALIELLELTMTVFSKGDAKLIPFTASCRPEVGIVAKFRTTVTGCRSTLLEPVAPFESVAVNFSSRWDGYS